LMPKFSSAKRRSKVVFKRSRSPVTFAL